MGRGGGKKDGSPEGTRDNLLQVPHSTRRQCGGVTPFPFFLPFLFGMFLCEACLPFFFRFGEKRKREEASLEPVPLQYCRGTRCH